MTMTAQDKLFTLEDLNFGGTNYRNMQPKNMWLTWWGDQLIQTDVEECYTIDAKTCKKTLLFTLDDINKWAESDEESNRYVRHLMNAAFPYPDKPLVQLGNRKAVILLDEEKDVICYASDGRALVFNSTLLQSKTSRASQGVNVMSLKPKKTLDAALPLSETHIQNVSRYRVRSLPGAGALLKGEDRGEEQLSLID